MQKKQEVHVTYGVHPLEECAIESVEASKEYFKDDPSVVFYKMPFKKTDAGCLLKAFPKPCKIGKLLGRKNVEKIKKAYQESYENRREIAGRAIKRGMVPAEIHAYGTCRLGPTYVFYPPRFSRILKFAEKANNTTRGFLGLHAEQDRKERTANYGESIIIKFYGHFGNATRLTKQLEARTPRQAIGKAIDYEYEPDETSWEHKYVILKEENEKMCAMTTVILFILFLKNNGNLIKKEVEKVERFVGVDLAALVMDKIMRA